MLTETLPVLADHRSMAETSRAAALAWSTWPQAAWLLLTGRTWRAALPIALLVGTLLSLINHGDVLLAGLPDRVTLIRVLANYAIPYVVSSVGCLSACRVRR